MIIYLIVDRPITVLFVFATVAAGLVMHRWVRQRPTDGGN
jgi:hypothetical protein